MWTRRLAALVLLFVGVLLLTGLSGILGWLLYIPVNPDNPEEKKPPLSEVISSTWDQMTGYVEGLPTGESFVYETVHNFTGTVETRYFFEEVGQPFVWSALNLILAGVLALVLGTFAGLFLARSGGWVKYGLEFLATVPDFAAAFFLQLLVVAIYKQTEWLLAEIFTTGTDTAYFLPFLSLFYIPFVYMVRMVSAHAWQVLTEDYILLAKAKGLDKRSIYLRHVLRNVIPVVKADLPRIASIMMGNLLVIEYLFNSPGVTLLMFSKGGFLTGNYNELVNAIWSFLAVFGAGYGAMRLALFGLERGFAHD